MAEMTRSWAKGCGFEMYSEEGYHSPTVSTISNTRKIDISALNKYLKTQGMMLSNGYGKLKDETMRIAHMGDLTVADIQTLLDAINTFLTKGA